MIMSGSTCSSTQSANERDLLDGPFFLLPIRGPVIYFTWP
jgi:hypothetical protein